MNKNQVNPHKLKPIDFVPALSGLIGKTALVTSFAVVWASQYQITNPDFVFENVRLEMIIGSFITLLAALLLPNTAPSGTLAPLIVLIPAMAAFGVHPFILSLFVGILGILGIKTKLFHKLLGLSGSVSKTSLTLTIGVSGVFLSVKNLISFFGTNKAPFYVLLLILTIVYILLRCFRKIWLIVPISACLSIAISYLFGIRIEFLQSFTIPSFQPSYWWINMWGIGFGFDLETILRTLPFAIFVVLLWAIDTLSIQTMLESNYEPDEPREEINLDRSIIITSLRNIIGGLFGGAQTSALWRSFLIPLFIVKRPLRPASILLGSLGIIAGFTAVPIMVLSFPPLIWSVLLFGIFLPFAIVGLQGLKNSENLLNKATIILAATAGIIVSPILTWISTMIYEIAQKHFLKDKSDKSF